MDSVFEITVIITSKVEQESLQYCLNPQNMIFFLLPTSFSALPILVHLILQITKHHTFHEKGLPNPLPKIKITFAHQGFFLGILAIGI